MCKLRFSQDVFQFNNAVGCAEERGASVAVAKPRKPTRFLKPSRFGFLHSCLFLLVPKLLLGNAVLEACPERSRRAPASRQDGKQELVRDGFPSRSLGTSGNAVIPAGIAGIQIPGMAKFAEIATPTANDRFRKLTPSFLLFLLTLLFLTTPMFAHAATAVGATPGSFKVNETGAATYTIPITVPPGTAGMAPTLSLNYNSQSGNGPLGVGWSLSGLSSITRCPATYAQDGFKGGITPTATTVFAWTGNAWCWSPEPMARTGRNTAPKPKATPASYPMARQATSVT